MEVKLFSHTLTVLVNNNWAVICTPTLFFFQVKSLLYLMGVACLVGVKYLSHLTVSH